MSVISIDGCWTTSQVDRSTECEVGRTGDLTKAGAEHMATELQISDGARYHYGYRRVGGSHIQYPSPPVDEPADERYVLVGEGDAAALFVRCDIPGLTGGSWWLVDAYDIDDHEQGPYSWWGVIRFDIDPSVSLEYINPVQVLAQAESCRVAA